MSFPGKYVQRSWHLVDATNQRVGRLANQVAILLHGKHKPTFRPNGDMGDHVVIINADKVTFSGNKWKEKLYRWHTGYPGGLKERRAIDMLVRNPTEILRKAILGMLKRNNLRHGYMEPRLMIYASPTHPHTAQLPLTVTPIAPHTQHIQFGNKAGLLTSQYCHPSSYQEAWAPQERPLERK